MALKSQRLELNGPWPFLHHPGIGFYIALGAGTLLRLFYVFFTEGTLDVNIWQGHARCVFEQGLLACYENGPYTLNHPPPMSLVAAGVNQLATLTGLPFSIAFRLPFVLLDGATALLLFMALSRAMDERIRRARFVFVALYWINPLSAVLSAHHGNTDIAVAFFLLASTLYVSQGRGFIAGALLGLSLWIKVPGLLGAPILLLALPSWKERFHFSLGLGLCLALGYGPWLVLDPELVIRSVFLYPGLMIQTTAGTRIWGLDVFYPLIAQIDPLLSTWIIKLRSFHYQWNTFICLIPILTFSILRETRSSSQFIIRGLAGTYIIFYGFSDFWAFQYLAWSLPFWFLLGTRMATATYLVSLVYLYGLYAWLTGSPWLLGDWAFIEKSVWPTALLWIRDAAVLTFFVSALILLIDTARATRTRWRETKRPLSWL